MRKKQVEFITQAPSVGFKEVHPGKSKTFTRGPDLPPSGGSDGIESKFIRCKQCGFPIDTEKTTEGSGWEGNIATRTTYPTTTMLFGTTRGGVITVGGRTTTYTTGYLVGRIIQPTAGNARWLVFYANPAASTKMTGAIYRIQDGTLVSMTKERTFASGAGWKVLEFDQPVSLSGHDDYIATVMGDGSWDLYFSGATNGGFEDWTSGASNAPDGWTAYSTITHTRDSEHKFGSYSAKLTPTGTSGDIYQDVHADKGISYWQGKTVCISCWVKCSTAGVARIELWDGATTHSDSSYHTGSGEWERLTATKTIIAAATMVRLAARPDNVTGTDTAYFDGFTFVEGTTPVDYSASSRYFVGTYFSGGTTDLTRAEQIDGPPARVVTWMSVAGTGSMYISSYKTITDTSAGFYSEVTGGCPFCGSSNYK